jgi:glycogen operon protein
LIGKPAHASERDDLGWYRPDGVEMTAEDWSSSYARAVTMALSGDTGAGGSPDYPFLLMLNAWWEPLDFRVPESLLGLDWRIEVDTAQRVTGGATADSSGVVDLTGRSLLLLRGVSSVSG